METQALFERIATSGDPLKAIDTLREHLTVEFVHRLNATTMDSARRGELEPALMGNTWALRVVRYLGDRELEAHTLFNRGQFGGAAGMLDVAESAYREAMPLYESHGSPQDLLDCAVALVETLLERGNPDAVELVARRALERVLGKSGEVSAGIGPGLIGLGNALRIQGERVLARECFDALLRIADQDPQFETEACGQLAEIATEEHDYDQAERLYRRALAADASLQHPGARASDLGNLGLVLYRRGDLDGAARAYAECLALRDRDQLHDGMDVDLRNAYHVLHHLGRHNEARELFRRYCAADPSLLGVVAAPSGYPVVLDNRGHPLDRILPG